jgi:hypothetical protein
MSTRSSGVKRPRKGILQMKTSLVRSKQVMFLIVGASVAIAVAACWQPPAGAVALPHRYIRLAHVVAISGVPKAQPLPTSQQAQTPYSLGKYKQAAEILARIARSPTFNAEQRALARVERRNCLEHLLASGSKIQHRNAHTQGAAGPESHNPNRRARVHNGGAYGNTRDDRSGN